MAILLPLSVLATRRHLLLVDFAVTFNLSIEAGAHRTTGHGAASVPNGATTQVRALTRLSGTAAGHRGVNRE
jgi:hypothetical protein